MRLDRVFVVAAVLILVGTLSNLLLPEAGISSYGQAPDAFSVALFRLIGGLSLGYAVLLWLSRGLPLVEARRAVLPAIIAASFVQVLVAVAAILSGGFGPAGWVIVVIDGLFLIVFGYYQFAGETSAAR